ncbi:UNVERIFIED_CONTAM: hypothetical protein FKN15_035476 [Acipenser sinensis]
MGTLDVCPYEDPFFVQPFAQGEVETMEEWLCLKSPVISPEKEIGEEKLLPESSQEASASARATAVVPHLQK